MKRCYDFCFSLLGLILLSPLLLLLAVIIKFTDGGPAFYRQCRIGQWGKPFQIVKFRSMVVNAERLGPSVTKEGDPRITRIGRFMRKTKLDELPQLWNVLRGDMSLVGPRPEVPQYVEKYTESQKAVLQLKPGITDLATLHFRNEEAMLRRSSDVEKYYLEFCVPQKIALNLAYAKTANTWEDTKIILLTLLPCLPIKPLQNDNLLTR